MKNPRVPVAREGYPFILFAAFVTIVTALLGYGLTAIGGIVLTGFTLYFFRDPERWVTDDPEALVSPADGKVIVVKKVFDDKFVKAEVYKISVFMDVFNVHVNRAPFSGTVDEIIYTPGQFYSANTNRGALENETCAVILKTDTDRKLAFVQMAGLIARRIVCWAEKGDTLVKGERFGLIRFGSRVDLYLPVDTKIAVKLGDKIKAGETILGYLS
nr:phosphatidylserine decarboxylase family protein [Desulfobulbaceae bacterium]